MKPISLGTNAIHEKIEIDFEKEEVNFILLAGYSGSGKSIFHNNLYKELTEKYTADELGFVFLDMTRVDFASWKSDYLIRPVIFDAKEAINVLYEVSELKTNKRIFIQIEECDMVAVDRKRFEEALGKLNEMSNVFIIYSTSRIDRTYLDNWMRRFIDMKVIFLKDNEDLVFLLGDDYKNKMFDKRGERIIALNNKFLFFEPFSFEEASVLENFSLNN